MQLTNTLTKSIFSLRCNAKISVQIENEFTRAEVVTFIVENKATINFHLLILMSLNGI